VFEARVRAFFDDKACLHRWHFRKRSLVVSLLFKLGAFLVVFFFAVSALALLLALVLVRLDPYFLFVRAPKTGPKHLLYGFFSLVLCFSLCAIFIRFF
jgi:hypothetical protein